MITRLTSANLRYLFIGLVILMAASLCFAQNENKPFSINESPLPPPTGFVNDFAGVIDAGTKQQLETKLKNLKDTSEKHVEIAVAVVKTTGGRPKEEYSLAVARGWKIGSKDDENPGALLFVAIDDRQYYTQVSKDLEDELPDGVVGSLQRQFLVPEFRKGNYSKGIADTIDAYISTIQNKGAAPTKPAQPANTGKRSSGAGGGIFTLICCAIIVIIVFIVISSFFRGGRGRNDRNRWGGGGGFGGGGGALPWIVGSAIGSALDNSSSSGSSSSWSDWGGSSGGGGDFGGFGGGGDFGGGGSGGDW